MTNRPLHVLALLAALAAGCINNDSAIRVYGLCSPPTPEDGGCLYPAACETMALGRLASDVASTDIDGPLVWPVQINNQRLSNADRAGGVETAYANIQGYRIAYSSPTVTAPDQEISALPGENTIQPESTTVVLVPVITRAAGTFLAGQVAAGATAEITASIRIYGSWGDGTSFETGPLAVQATLCNGCLDPAVVAYCPAATPTLTGACPQLRQSAVVTCE